LKKDPLDSHVIFAPLKQVTLLLISQHSWANLDLLLRVEGTFCFPPRKVM